MFVHCSPKASRGHWRPDLTTRSLRFWTLSRSRTLRLFTGLRLTRFKSSLCFTANGTYGARLNSARDWLVISNVSEKEKAVFRLAATSDVLQNPNESRMQPVWKMNHTQDRFVLEVRKTMDGILSATGEPMYAATMSGTREEGSTTPRIRATTRWTSG